MCHPATSVAPNRKSRRTAPISRKRPTPWGAALRPYRGTAVLRDQYLVTSARRRASTPLARHWSRGAPDPSRELPRLFSGAGPLLKSHGPHPQPVADASPVAILLRQVDPLRSGLEPESDRVGHLAVVPLHRPPRLDDRSGSGGSIRAHCASVNGIPRPTTAGHGRDRCHLSGRWPRAKSPHVPHERVQSTEEDHNSSRDPENRCPGAVLTNGPDDQQHAGKDTEGRDQSADADSHMDIINDNLGQRERSKRIGLAHLRPSAARTALESVLSVSARLTA